MTRSFARAPRPFVVTAGAALAISAALAARAKPTHAQQPLPPQPPQAAAVYRLPTITLVQPPAEGSVPQDRPLVVFRFFQGEPGDPIDASSFEVGVDGHDRTALFRITATEAWGPLADPAQSAAEIIAVGTHEVTARICSSRGACSTTARVVNVASPPAGQTAAPSQSGDTRRQRIIDALLHAARKLLIPQ